MINLLCAIFMFGVFQIENDFLKKWESDFSKITALKNYTPYPSDNPRALKGDFFGDGVLDFVFQVEDPSGNVKLIFINQGTKRTIQFLGNDDDPFDMHDYKWAEIFKKVNKGEVLWSNFTDDFRKLSEVPANEKVYLKYDALYLHAAESCGGGFVYWKDGSFHWLQQE